MVLEIRKPTIRTRMAALKPAAEKLFLDGKHRIADALSAGDETAAQAEVRNLESQIGTLTAAFSVMYVESGGSFEQQLEKCKAAAKRKAEQLAIDDSIEGQLACLRIDVQLLESR